MKGKKEGLSEGKNMSKTGHFVRKKWALPYFNKLKSSI
jgi:hypothetical protein